MKDIKIKYLFYHYRVNKGNQDKENCKSFDKFKKVLKKYVKNEDERNELLEAALYIENVAAEQNFKAGYKCALKSLITLLVKECEK